MVGATIGAHTDTHTHTHAQSQRSQLSPHVGWRLGLGWRLTFSDGLGWRLTFSAGLGWKLTFSAEPSQPKLGIV